MSTSSGTGAPSRDSIEVGTVGASLGRRGVLVLLAAGVLGAAATRPARAADPPLTMAFTPSKDPAALQESANAFVQVVTRVSGVPFAPRSPRTTRGSSRR